MKNKEWIKKHIKILTNNPSSEELIKLFEEKINLINRPYYKFCSFPQNINDINWNVENLKNNLLFFQNPENFNDPFDCFLGFSINSILKDAVIKSLKSKKQYNYNTKLFIEQFFKPSKELNIGELEEITEKIFVEFIDYFLQNEDVSKEEKYLFAKTIKDLFMKEKAKNELLLKFINNGLTIKDKKEILESLYNNKDFKKIIKQQTSCDDALINIIKRDMQLKVENGESPDLFTNKKSSQSSMAILDTFSMIYDFLSSETHDINIKEIRETIIKTTNQLLPNIRKLISEYFKITCLSECLESPLMWAHYTDKHQGFCLEYDFTHSNHLYIQRKYPDYFFNRLLFFPVDYSQKRPQLTKAFLDSKTLFEFMKTKKLSPNFTSNLLYSLLIKSEDWKYEKEWRIVKIGKTNTTRI